MTYMEYDKETLDKLHQVELEILDDFVSVCKKHNLNTEYCIFVDF